MFIDVHAHLNSEKFNDCVDDVVLNAKNNCVGKIICASSDYNSSKQSILLSKKYSNVYSCIGVHPEDCFCYNEEVENFFYDNKDNLKVVAIGEIGLDYYDLETQIDYARKYYPNEKITEEIFIEKQKEVFVKQIELASRMGLPIVIHSRDATKDTLDIVKANASKITHGGLVHCFSGSSEIAKEYFKLGFYISVGGVVTFKNSKNLPQVVKDVGIDRIMLETDCPYLSPEPFRGKLNEPKNIPIIADKISDILEIPTSEVERITTNNAYKLFGRLK